MKGKYINIILLSVMIGLSFIFLFILFLKPSISFFYKGYETDYIEVELDGEVKDIIVKSKFLNKDISNRIKRLDEYDTSKVGRYEIKYELKYFIYNIHKSLEVIVTERDMPIITLKGEEKVESCSIDTYVEDGYSAYDNYDGDITNKVVIEKDRVNNKIIYSVNDSSNNITKVERTIISTDNSAPEIIINGSDKIYIEVGNTYSEEGFSIKDNCDSEIVTTSTKGEVNTKKVGTYEIKYSATDSTGNIGTKTRYVYVFDSKSGTNKSSDEKGVIYLTFDDGPSIYTTKILDTLKKYDIKATFFVTSNGQDKLIKREYNEGHTVALHTYSHIYKKVYSSQDNYFKDLNKISSRVEKITNEKSMIIRFPGGSSNTISKSIKKGIMSTLTKEVSNRGYHYFDWTLSIEDAGKCSSKKTDESKERCIYNNFVKGIKKDRINIILMHDIKYFTANKLDDMIKYALSQDYKFDKITMETKEVHQNLNN